MSSPEAHENPRVISAITEQREAAREQLSAAWRLQMFRIEEALAAGWQEQIERVVDERFAALTERILEECSTEIGGRVARQIEDEMPVARENARREAAGEFQRAARRFASCATERDWNAALLGAVSHLCDKALLFTIAGASLKAAPPGGPEGEIPVSSAPAILSAIGSRAAVVAGTSPEEISPEIAALLESPRCAVVPVVVRGAIAAVIVAAGEALNVQVLETMAILAGLALERRGKFGGASAGEEEAVHLEARRFARVRAAEIRLYQAEAVRKARAGKNLYRELKQEIDAAREDYRRRYLEKSGSIPDYFHVELVRTLANEDVVALGEDYPGPLV